ncbi:MAG: universal stress protein [Chloroflexi bacterium]|nr:universal stress protein [Chloroflexota bacterium]
MAYQNVVVAVDGSQTGDLALRRALGIARAAGARLVVLGVEEPAPPFAGGSDWGRRNGQLQAAVEAAVGAARQAGVEVEGQVCTGYPAEVIVRYCAEHACDLVVLGANEGGDGPLGRTADKVVDLATCAVLVAR